MAWPAACSVAQIPRGMEWQRGGRDRRAGVSCLLAVLLAPDPLHLSQGLGADLARAAGGGCPPRKRGRGGGRVPGALGGIDGRRALRDGSEEAACPCWAACQGAAQLGSDGRDRRPAALGRLPAPSYRPQAESRSGGEASAICRPNSAWPSRNSCAWRHALCAGSARADLVGGLFVRESCKPLC